MLNTIRLLRPIDAPPDYQTAMGAAYVGDAADFLQTLEDQSVNLIITSLPSRLEHALESVDVTQPEYLDSFISIARGFRRVLADDGSLIIDVGLDPEPSESARSRCQRELQHVLETEVDLTRSADCRWCDAAYLPANGEAPTCASTDVAGAVHRVWWFSRRECPKGDDCYALIERSADMNMLLERHMQAVPDEPVAPRELLPANVLVFDGTSEAEYVFACRAAGLRPHPGPFPVEMAMFFICRLTDPGDLVLDPFAGSNVAGAAAEREGRRWLAFERQDNRLHGGRLRFEEFARR